MNHRRWVLLTEKATLLAVQSVASPNCSPAVPCAAAPVSPRLVTLEGFMLACSLCHELLVYIGEFAGSVFQRLGDVFVTDDFAANLDALFKELLVSGRHFSWRYSGSIAVGAPSSGTQFLRERVNAVKIQLLLMLLSSPSSVDPISYSREPERRASSDSGAEKRCITHLHPAWQALSSKSAVVSYDLVY